MQEIKILAILSLVYIIFLSAITILNLISKNNFITRTINSKSLIDKNSVLFYCFILSLLGTIASLYLSEIN